MKISVDDIQIKFENGTIIYLDEVKAILEDSFYYINEYVEATPDKLAVLRDKKEKYELLKLSTSKNELKNLIATESKEIIKDVLINQVSDNLENFKSEINMLTLHSRKEVTNSLGKFSDEINSLVTEITDFRSTLNVLKTQTDRLLYVEKELHSELDKVSSSSISNDLKNNNKKLEETIIEFDKINSKLKELFN